jgi:hypothetical protein
MKAQTFEVLLCLSLTLCATRAIRTSRLCHAAHGRNCHWGGWNYVADSTKGSA